MVCTKVLMLSFFSPYRKHNYSTCYKYQSNTATNQKNCQSVVIAFDYTAKYQTCKCEVAEIYRNFTNFSDNTMIFFHAITLTLPLSQPSKNFYHGGHGVSRRKVIFVSKLRGTPWLYSFAPLYSNGLFSTP